MFRYVFVILIACLLAGIVACDKVNIPGNVAGQILDQNGAPRGLVTVQLIEADTGKVALQETADDMGNYFFSNVSPGSYTITTLWGGRDEMPNDVKEFRLLPGKTKNLTITVSDPVANNG